MHDCICVNTSGWCRGGETICVYTGSYEENVGIGTTSLMLVGEGADVVTVTAANSGDHIFEVTNDYVNISGFTVTSAPTTSAGIALCSTEWYNISDNTANSNNQMASTALRPAVTPSRTIPSHRMAVRVAKMQ